MQQQGGQKRKADEELAIVAKKQRTTGPDAQALAVASRVHSALIPAGVRRTSSLDAPIMQLTGHSGEVFAAQIQPEGNALASASFDKSILLWNVRGECVNYDRLTGHKSAVLDLSWSPDSCHLVSCSADKSVALWDAGTGQRIKKFSGHQSFVQSCAWVRRGDALMASASDDCTVRVWDGRTRRQTVKLTHTFPVTAVEFSEDGDQVFTGGVDNFIHVWDVRKQQELYTLKEHRDTITSLKLSPDATQLLSNSMDGTLRISDIRSFAPGRRCLKIFQGHQHNYEKQLIGCAWSPDGRQIASGSSDRCVYVWDVLTSRLLYRLPGHKGSVNDVDFHPTEPIIASGSSDKTIFIGELGGA